MVKFQDLGRRKSREEIPGGRAGGGIIENVGSASGPSCPLPCTVAAAWPSICPSLPSRYQLSTFPGGKGQQCRLVKLHQKKPARTQAPTVSLLFCPYHMSLILMVAMWLPDLQQLHPYSRKKQEEE